MPENTATAWLRALKARGVNATLRNNRLWLHPASAYGALSDDELLTLRHHRQEIKDLIRSGVDPAPRDEHAPESQPEPPQPEPPPMPEHIRRIVEWNSPEEEARRDAEATEVMYRTVGTTSPYLWRTR
jgi:hypothetical protein